MKNIFISKKIYFVFTLTMIVLAIFGYVAIKKIYKQTTAGLLCFVSSHLEWPGKPCPQAVIKTGSIGTLFSSTPFVLSATPASQINGWKVYVDKEHRFIFEYPPSLVLVNDIRGINSLFLDDKDGKHVIYLDRAYVFDSSNMEERMKSFRLLNDFETYEPIKLFSEKIIDTTSTIGYLSSWKYYVLGAVVPGQKTKVISINVELGSRLRGISDELGNNRVSEVYLEINDLPGWSPISPDLFRRIVSTFRFTE